MFKTKKDLTQGAQASAASASLGWRQRCWTREQRKWEPVAEARLLPTAHTLQNCSSCVWEAGTKPEHTQEERVRGHFSGILPAAGSLAGQLRVTSYRGDGDR